ncbi:hypothetical protein C2G38_1533121 [Gigaspora rosea]|uniref:MD-2-related lipid-recognition domain-containing protein n=1 Tax=Gigaspora rosea TaxID=44941 RepID=A0A397WCH2_9GLOM|nr:hypothetical protein C2G38_1533121 [Gigaspora rosea]
MFFSYKRTSNIISYFSTKRHLNLKKKKNKPKFLPTSQVMKNFIFASILLAIILTVNAAPFQLNKRALTFGHCDVLKEPADLLDVEIVPITPVFGRNESFHVSGKLTKHDIIADQTILLIKYQDETGKDLDQPYAQAFTRSIKAGNAFRITASRVYTPKLPRKYLLGVIVGDPSNAAPFGCALAKVGI